MHHKLYEILGKENALRTQKIHDQAFMPGYHILCVECVPYCFIFYNKKKIIMQ
jgi:hypothetical protein